MTTKTTTKATSTTQLLARYMRPQAKKVTVLGVCLLASKALPLFGPQILADFVDIATAGGAYKTLVNLAQLYLVIAFGRQILGVVATYLAESVGWSSTNALRTDTFRHVLRLDLAWHRSKTSGELIERVDGDITALSNFFSAFVIHIFGSVLLLIGLLFFSFREDWRVGVLMTVFSASAITVMAILRQRSVPSAIESREKYAQYFGFIEERLAGVEDIRSNGAGNHVMRGFARTAREAWVVWNRSERKGILIWVASMILYVSSLALVLGAAGYLFFTDQITLGRVLLLFLYMQMLDEPVTNISAQLKDFQRAGAGISRIGQLFLEQPTIVTGTKTLPAGPLSVELDSVSFAYEGNQSVLDDFSLRLEPGEVVGVLGRTGSGKTTLARLVLRLYDLDEHWTARVGGVDLRDIQLRNLRHRVGVVTQDVQLFEGTLRENITLFDSSHKDERILEVLAELGLFDFVSKYKGGLDGKVSSGGEGMSAGEAQLLAFTRLFLRDPGLVIMDEATSRLDPATQALLERAVTKLLANRTGIVIAHRLKTLLRADKILILEKGRVIEFGGCDELRSNPNSKFSEFLAKGLEEVLV